MIWPLVAVDMLDVTGTTVQDDGLEIWMLLAVDMFNDVIGTRKTMSL